MTTHRRQRAGGFSLTELIVAIAILSLLLSYIIVISGQMLVVSAKVRGRDMAISLAQQTIEDIRSTLIVPGYPIPRTDTPRDGYLRTITSTYATLSGTTLLTTLWDVTVQVTGPISGATLKTYIQTYRPQVNFIFPSSNKMYLSNKTTNLVGTILGPTGTITKSNVELRSSNDGGSNWTGWQSLASNIFTTRDCTQPVTQDPLQIGTVYFFNYQTTGTGADGTTLDLQVRATDSKGYYNFQPAEANCTSWVQLITDKTSPQLGTIQTHAPTLVAIPPLAFTVSPSFSTTVTDTLSGAHRVYYVIKRVSGATQYWDSTAAPTPTWTTELTYNPADSVLEGQWDYPGTSTPSLAELFNASFVKDPNAKPGAYYYLQVFALDRAIGRYYDYKTTIVNQELQSNAMPWSNINANYSATHTLTLVQVDTPTTQSVQATVLSPTSVRLSAQINPNGLPTDAWFEYGISTSTLLTQSSPVGTGAPLGFSFVPFTQTVTTLTPSTTYYYRVWARNAGGITTNTPTDNVFAWLSFPP
jgi:prepilin-type N-terminal cleavage/methylation domain-containing protein